MLFEKDERITAFRQSFEAGLEYARPYFEQYYRLYQLWRVKRFSELESTFSKINLGLFHSAVQDRMPKIFDNVFSSDQFVFVDATDPVSELTKDGAQSWLLSTLDSLNYKKSIIPTLQATLIGGTGYRLVTATYVRDGDGKWQKRIGRRDLDFFSVIPAPGGGHTNTFDNNSDDAIPWVMVVDHWTEDKIKELAKRGVLEKDSVRKLLKEDPQDQFPEDQYRDAFSTVGNLVYANPATLRTEVRNADPDARYRRIVHWIKRDRHLIIGEDCVVLYDGKNNTGTIPIAKYVICPDANNWFGVSYLQIQEDLLKAIVLNVNYRMDNLIGTMFPTTYIRKDIADAGKYKESDFYPKPFDVKFYPASTRNERIRDLVWVDRRGEVSPQSFLDEDRLKALLQKIAGQTETTSSMADIVGNRTATGITSILSELAGRPNMEASIFEHTGVRDECTLLLSLASEHIEGDQFIRIRNTRKKDGFPWLSIDTFDLQQKYTVRTRGAKYLAEKNQNFQRMLAMYPLWNNSPVWDQYELARQSAIVADFLPDIDRALVPPKQAAPQVAPLGMEEPERPGGLASAMDIRQPIESVANRTAPEPRTGAQRRALDIGV